jgi:hypothetical protein
VATFLYGVTSQQAEATGLNWPGLTVWGLLVDKTYLPKINVDQHVSDIPASAIIARIGPMTSLASVNGLCSGILPQFLALINTLPAFAIVLYINGGSDAASQLIYYSSDGIGFPLALQGFNYAIAYDQAHGGWFQV